MDTAKTSSAASLLGKSLPEIARQFSKAVERGKGLRLSAADLKLLTSFGILGMLQVAAANLLKEKICCQDKHDQNLCMSGEATGSTGIARRTALSGHPTWPSSGMIPAEDASDLLAHAQMMLRKPG